MNRKFARNLIVGGLVGASLSLLMNDNKSRSARKMMRQGRTFVRRSGNIINSVIEMLK